MASDNARIYIVRHGETDMNDSGNEKFRGWSDPPLNDQGLRDAHQAGSFLANKGVGHIFSSDLGRTMDTAKVISQYTGAEVTPTAGLRTWNLGIYTGEPVKPNAKAVEKYQKQPQVPVPQGEPYSKFVDRFRGTLKSILGYSAKNNTAVAMVTHTSNIDLLSGKGTRPAKDVLPPGGITQLDFKNGRMKLTNLDQEEGKANENPHFEE